MVRESKTTLDKDKDKNQKPSLPSPPIAPGMVMYDQGYIYFSDTFEKLLFPKVDFNSDKYKNIRVLQN